MNFGYFDDDNREYVITKPNTPAPWCNYLGSPEYGAIISNNAGGYSFVKSGANGRILRYHFNSDDTPGRYIYLRDDENGDYWSASWQPVGKDLNEYKSEVHHGTAYTKMFSEYAGIKSEAMYYVPLNKVYEVWCCKVTNTSDKPRKISVFGYAELSNDDNYNQDQVNLQYSLCTTNTSFRKNKIYQQINLNWYKGPDGSNGKERFFGLAGQPVTSYNGDKEAFIGLYHDYGNPVAVERGKCDGVCNYNENSCGALHTALELAPGETKTYVFVLGYVENPIEEKWVGRAEDGVINRKRADELLSRFDTAEKADAALVKLKDYWNELLSHFTISSSEEKLDRMVNIWHQYQCMVTFNMSRSASYFESGIGRGMGFRDSCQDLLGFVHLIPDRARERILDIAATQFEDGSAYHQYQPLTKKGNSDIGSGFNDDPLWLIAATAAYIKETGDYTILDEMTPYDSDASKATTFMEHLRRSFHYTMEHLGPHNLPLIGRADWNDCLNLNCFSTEPGESFQTFGPSEGPNAESVFIAGMFVRYGKDYAAICRHQGMTEEAELAEKAIAEMEKTVMDAGWDGEWYLRAYDHYKNKIGSKECEDGKIFIEPQGFCVIAEIGLEEGCCLKAMESVEKYLDTKYGIVLLQPPYHRYHVELGEISSYPPGYKENAGIFCHNNPWISIAETVVGRGNRAWQVYTRTCPAYIEDISEIHRTEPYVYSQMIAGKDAPNFGEAKNSWLTGTAAWTFVNLSQAILGVQPSYDGLSIDPCIPEGFGDFTLTRRFRGATYYFDVKNPNNVEKGVAYLEVDGKHVNGNVVPVEDGKTEYHVTVHME